MSTSYLFLSRFVSEQLHSITPQTPRSNAESKLRRSQTAAEALIGRIYPVVIKIVRRNLPERDSEEDLVQQVLAKVFSNLETFRGVVPLEHWVSRIALNACLNRLRGERARPELRWADLSQAQADALSSVISEKSLHPDEDLSARDLVNRLLESVSPMDRLIIRMMEMEGLSVKEISSRTGWRGTFIRVRAFRARKKLNRKYLDLWKRGRL